MKTIVFNFGNKKVSFSYNEFIYYYADLVKDLTGKNEIEEIRDVFKNDHYEVYDNFVGNVTKEFIKSNSILLENYKKDYVDELMDDLISSEYPNFSIVDNDDILIVDRHYFSYPKNK